MIQKNEFLEKVITSLPITEAYQKEILAIGKIDNIDNFLIDAKIDKDELIAAIVHALGYVVDIVDDNIITFTFNTGATDSRALIRSCFPNMKIKKNYFCMKEKKGEDKKIKCITDHSWLDSNIVRKEGGDKFFIFEAYKLLDYFIKKNKDNLHEFSTIISQFKKIPYNNMLKCEDPNFIDNVEVVSDTQLNFEYIKIDNFELSVKGGLTLTF